MSFITEVRCGRVVTQLVMEALPVELVGEIGAHLDVYEAQIVRMVSHRYRAHLLPPAPQDGLDLIYLPTNPVQREGALLVR